MDEQPINQSMDQPMRPRLIVPRVCVGIILGVWVASGFSKVLDMSGFVNTIAEHKVLPQELFGLMWWVGPGELMLGLLLVFAMGSELTKFFGRAVLVISMLLIAGFTYYLSMVSDAVLLESGCGCLEGLKRIDFGMDVHVRTVKYVTNGGLMVLHLVALFGPGVILRRYEKRVASVEEGNGQ